MNKKIIYLLNTGKRVHEKIFSSKKNFGINHEFSDATLRSDEASDLIRSRLADSEPFMVTRFGAIEMACIANYLGVSRNKTVSAYLQYIAGNTGAPWWDNNIVFGLQNNTGFFPNNPDAIERFARLLIEDMKTIDVLGSWLFEERLFNKNLSHVIKIRLPDIEPYYHSNPWSELLAGKKVLVIHPFEKSIQLQYKKHHLLFSNRLVLPKFDLITLKAVQTIAGNRSTYSDWFQELDSMKNKISNIDFDIALLGCGAYGYPLAAHVKRMNKKSIHLGGALQILFGIIGRRWEDHFFISQLFNKYWCHPLREEVPKNFENVEAGAYW